MKKRIKLYGLLVATLVLCSHIGFAQLQKDICEELVPTNWQVSNGKLEISQERFKIGDQSIKWDWGQDSRIAIVDTAFGEVLKDPRSTFVFWLYNEKGLDDQLRFTFYNGQTEVYHFDFNLNFTGWRTAWVMYHRDMVKLANEDIDRMVIHAPKTVISGSVYLDQLMYYVNINPRSPMRDLQVPFVNLDGDKAANAHWNSLYKFNATSGYLPLQSKVSAQDIAEFDQITRRHIDLIVGKKVRDEQEKLQELREEFAFWNIRRDGGRITGRTIYSVNDIELTSDAYLAKAKAANEISNIKRYAQLMLSIAQLHFHSADPAIKKELQIMYIDLLDHMEDQGWAYGSGMGALHHLGYNLGDYYHASLIMKDVIKEQGRLQRTFKAMYWFSGLGRMLEHPDQLPVSNIDVFNTLLGSMLSTALVLDDGPEKLRYLQHFSRWMSYNVSPNLEITGAFKPDGAVFHHGTLYPAYGVGGYSGLAPIIYVLSKTQFQIDAQSHQIFKDNMLMMHYYTNPTRWPISISGRHPTGNWRIPDTPYAYMALAGSPDGEEIDRQMAAVYLLVARREDVYAKKFRAMGIAPAVYPAMHHTLNFGLLDIHRRKDWLLTIKGHNRYIVSHESYPNANVFGRYSSYGQLEVLYPENKTGVVSNFRDEGWDWNRIPGATTLHVPLDFLRADIKNVDDFSGVEEMLLTDELFAGGVHLDKQGLFAMKLRGHDKYDMGSFRATKSWFTFDSLVVALGSDISNDIAQYPTETILFQNYLPNRSDALQVNGKQIDEFPYRSEKAIYSVLDNRNIGYYIPEEESLRVYKEHQVSRDQKDLRDTEGDFAGLYIDHGRAPKDDKYEYAMLIDTDAEKLKEFVATMKGKQPLYSVLRQDSVAHSVKYHPQNLTGLSIFRSAQNLGDKYIVSNNKPCSVMYREGRERLDLAVVDPDLGFYEGADETPKNTDGTRKEVSIYSRYWFKAPAQPSVVQITIRGEWKKLDNNDQGYDVKNVSGGRTLLTIHCKYGLTTDIRLTKK